MAKPLGAAARRRLFAADGDPVLDPAVEQSISRDPKGRTPEFGVRRDDLQLRYCAVTSTEDAEHSELTPGFRVVPLQGNHLIPSGQVFRRRGHLQLGIVVQQLRCCGPVACLVPLVEAPHQLFGRHPAMVSDSSTCCSAMPFKVRSCFRIMMRSPHARNVYRAFSHRRVGGCTSSRTMTRLYPPRASTWYVTAITPNKRSAPGVVRPVMCWLRAKLVILPIKNGWPASRSSMPGVNSRGLRRPRLSSQS